MSINSLSTSSRIVGMSSGMDTESLVKAMLAYSQARVDKQFQKKTTLEWKRDAYRDVNTQLRNFRQGFLSTQTPQSNMLSNAAYRIYKTSLLTDTKAVTVSAGDKAAVGTVTINKITSLASSAKTQSSEVIMDPATASLGTKLGELEFTTGLVFEDDEIAFSINGREFTFTKDNTLSDVISKVNSDSAAGVQMSFRSLTTGLTITSRAMGASSAVEIENIKGNAFSTEDVAGAFAISEGTYYGTNAKLTIDNVAVERESNSFTIDGITYSLKDVSTSAISFSVEQDIDATVDKVKAFVTAYNELVDKLQTKLNEQVKFGYDPLTDEQREAMEEDEAKKWDEAAKSGILRNDSTVSNLLSSMRKALYTAVGDTGLTPANLGLTTGTWSDQGKITLDEKKLRAAIEKNPDAVTTVFVGTSSATDANVRFNESGLISRISTAMSQCTSQLSSVSISNLDRNISNAGNALTELQARLAEEEEKYWAKMTAMETALSSLNSQNSWLTSQLSMLG